ncbi:MAG: Hsp20/alpha crystallin family protein [Candidatus Nitronauta litoralis]|uniref:Hsp20/alpha crystallin family protein n=1 Tax=Candidatus Nitronauta litoralis TaxID=2705533 RepID=A0A7T0BVG6_9BACT|nr:MAG: Hsp20/alpha crystallin family protein [Candidatus Nitronauta litoralis]
MKTDDSKKDDQLDSLKKQMADQELIQMNRSYLESLGAQRKNKTIRWLWALIACLVLMIGVQSYFLFNKNPDNQFSHNQEPGLINPNLFPKLYSQDSLDPFSQFQQMQKRMDRFFDQNLNQLKGDPFSMRSFSFGGPFSQNFDLTEENDRYIVSLDLPGLDKTKLDVTIEEQTLKISGTIEELNETKEEDKFFKSQSSSHIERYMTLPGPVKPESLQIDVKNDKLIVEVQKK